MSEGSPKPDVAVVAVVMSLASEVFEFFCFFCFLRFFSLDLPVDSLENSGNPVFSDVSTLSPCLLSITPEGI
jgi:hypothetical protein